MDEQSKSWEDIVKTWITYLSSMPAVAVALLFMWLSGIIINFLVFGTHAEFVKHKKYTQSFYFNLAMGVLPGAIIEVIYHLAVYRTMITRPDDFALSAIPAAMILASLTFIAAIWRAYRS